MMWIDWHCAHVCNVHKLGESLQPSCSFHFNFMSEIFTTQIKVCCVYLDVLFSYPDLISCVC